MSAGTVRDLNRRRTEQLGVDAIVDEGSFQRDRPPSVADRRGKGGKVAGQHCCRRSKGFTVRRILADRGALIAAKEKDLIVFDRTAQCSTKLVALQRVMR